MKFPKLNVYVCEACLRVIPTVHVHEGVAPAMIACPYSNPKKDQLCGGNCLSFFYRVPPPFYGFFGMGEGQLGANLAPKFEWYKPTPEEMVEKRFSEEAKDHVDRGGLMMRPRTSMDPLWLDTAEKEMKG